MHYKIVGIQEGTPDEPQVYHGTLQLTNEPAVMTAMVQQFGEPGKPAADCLNQWSGGMVSDWLEDLEEDPNTDNFICCNGNSTFHILVWSD